MEMSNEQIHDIASAAWNGYQYLQKLTVRERADLMYAIAEEIEALDEELINAAHRETALPLARLQGEKGRTVHQWRSYADALRTGVYADVRIDTGDGAAKSDIRKYNKGLGPVAVFGASNFPFAFSTAGGDTASAIAAGCSVVYKEHPAHPETSRIMEHAIKRGVAKFGAPDTVFDCVKGSSNSVGETLVLNPLIKAVAFTGSFRGGKALFDLGASRSEPVPVFAEMGSVNPILALPDYLNQHGETLAAQYVASLTLGVGQFCTNPGLFIAVKGSALTLLKEGLKKAISEIGESSMLHAGICKAFQENKTILSKQPDVELLGKGVNTQEDKAGAAIYLTSGAAFLANQHLREEVFGPVGLVVECSDTDEVYAVLASVPGQLTITFAATVVDIQQNSSLLTLAQEKCGRLLFGGMPTGVEVVYAMQHGGPFPATTDSRFTSVGPDAVKRFLRPVSFQNWPNQLLPQELQDDNPLKIARIVNTVYTPE
ncbi:aldehyde dehydrogenase (NADP(+)) [Sphingobacterium suaedae]|uniref:Aldehyde dehydrogenase (NADP(+)) n=1 Tax=Sphingobacterium suaedae TaxID=1686402 RepID=A0ABW5KL21_9SPHI